MKIFRSRLVLVALCALLPLFTSCAPKTPQYPSVARMNVYCLGDSITSGFRLSNPAKYSFPSQLARMSQNNWKVSNGGVPGATLQKSGDIPIWKQPQFAEVKELNPDIVIVILGTNDTKDKNWQHIDGFEKDYTELINHLKSEPSQSKLYICSLPPIIKNYRGGMSNKRAAELSRQVKEIATTTGVQYIDITSSLKGKANHFIDGLNPNQKGAKVIPKLFCLL